MQYKRLREPTAYVDIHSAETRNWLQQCHMGVVLKTLKFLQQAFGVKHVLPSERTIGNFLLAIFEG